MLAFNVQLPTVPVHTFCRQLQNPVARGQPAADALRRDATFPASTPEPTEEKVGFVFPSRIRPSVSSKSPATGAPWVETGTRESPSTPGTRPHRTLCRKHPTDSRGRHRFTVVPAFAHNCRRREFPARVLARYQWSTGLPSSTGECEPAGSRPADNAALGPRRILSGCMQTLEIPPGRSRSPRATLCHVYGGRTHSAGS